MEALSDIDAKAEAILASVALKKRRIETGASSKLHHQLVQSACAMSTALFTDKKGLVSSDRVLRGKLQLAYLSAMTDSAGIRKSN